MKSTLTATLLLIALGASAELSTWQIGSRQLPPPAGASPEIQAAIAGSEIPNAAQTRQLRPSSLEQWRALIAQRARQRAVSLEDLGKKLNISIERDELAGVKIHRVTPKTLNPQHKDHLFIYIHGGAYVFNGGDVGVSEGAVIASFAGIPLVSIDYRMPPDHPHPAAIQDVEAVYRELLKSFNGSAMAMGGTSAGGGLTLAAVHHFKDKDLPLPGALYAGTPWADLTKTSDSLYTNEGIDRVLVTYDGMLAAAARLYAGGADLTDPLLSPVYGDFKGFPPSYLVTGTRDMFLSETARTHRRLRSAGVIADLNVYEGLSHAEYAMVPGSPEFEQVYAELAAFLAGHLTGE